MQDIIIIEMKESDINLSPVNGWGLGEWGEADYGD